MIGKMHTAVLACICLHSAPVCPCSTGMADLEIMQIRQQASQHRPGALQGGLLLLHNRLAGIALLDPVPDADGGMPRSFCGQDPAQQGPGCLRLLGHLLHTMVCAWRVRLLSPGSCCSGPVRAERSRV